MDTKRMIELYEDRLDGMIRVESENALLRLMKAFEKEITGLIEYDTENNEHGIWFHKSFRQTDVTGNADVDMAFWNLLKVAPQFFTMLKVSR